MACHWESICQNLWCFCLNHFVPTWSHLLSLVASSWRITIKFRANNKKRSHTQLDSRKQVIAFQDRVMTINIKEAQHPLKWEKQVIDKSSIMLKISTKSMHRVLVWEIGPVIQHRNFSPSFFTLNGNRQCPLSRDPNGTHRSFWLAQSEWNKSPFLNDFQRASSLAVVTL